jgi:hypothetical protein
MYTHARLQDCKAIPGVGDQAYQRTAHVVEGQLHSGPLKDLGKDP